MNNFSKTYYDNPTKESKKIDQLRDENLHEIEEIIYDQVAGDYDFPHGLEKIIEERLNDEEVIFDILVSMEVINDLGMEIVEEEEEDNE